jgi:hypothetical protein
MNHHREERTMEENGEEKVIAKKGEKRHKETGKRTSEWKTLRREEGEGEMKGETLVGAERERKHSFSFSYIEVLVEVFLYGLPVFAAQRCHKGAEQVTQFVKVQPAGSEGRKREWKRDT